MFLPRYDLENVSSIWTFALLLCWKLLMKDRVKIFGRDAVCKKIVLFSAMLLLLGHAIVSHQHGIVTTQLVINTQSLDFNKSIIDDLFSTDHGTGHLEHFKGSGAIAFPVHVGFQVDVTALPINKVLLYSLSDQNYFLSFSGNTIGLRAPPST